MKPIVIVDHLSKRFLIGGLHAGYQTLRESLAGSMLAPFKRMRRGHQESTQQELWALKDISFEVEPGEVVGLIGHNGAGKSTLLKILARITNPTEGRFELYGRIGSLLEVGTGFHPDLTGRENIFLSGTIIGIKKAELARKFDEIVSFSELERFIDTPVKWYSSGMYLRLAFSVAAHLDTEILAMDEVLAVGDVSFQQKCLDRMNEVRREGRTILFVSHSMAAVTRLCKRVIWIDKGRIVSDGPAQQVINSYLGTSWNFTAERVWENIETSPGNEIVRIRKVRLCTEGGRTAAAFDIRHPIGVEMVYDVLQPDHVLTPCFDLLNEEDVHLFAVQDVGRDWLRRPRPVGRYTSTVWIPGNSLTAGNLIVNAAILSHLPASVLHVRQPKVVAFQVMDRHGEGTARGDYVGPVPGVIRPLLDWTTHLSEG